jgi:hypothetical protein
MICLFFKNYAHSLFLVSSIVLPVADLRENSHKYVVEEEYCVFILNRELFLLRWSEDKGTSTNSLLQLNFNTFWEMKSQRLRFWSLNSHL